MNPQVEMETGGRLVSGQKTGHPNKLQGVQVLRGAAALLVMFAHLKFNLGIPAENTADTRWLASNIGAIGVDIFFVISGFVIAMTAAKLGDNWRAFLAHRIARIVPLYFTVSTYVVVRGIAKAIFEKTSFPWSFAELFNTYLFIPVFDTRHFQCPVLANGWTLSFEMWFYLCFAGLMIFVGGKRAGKILPWALAAGVILAILFYHADGWFLPKFLLHPIVLEFCAGCILYHARAAIGKKTACAMFLLLPPLFYFANRSEFLGESSAIVDDRLLGLYRAGVWGGFAVCLVGIVLHLDLNRPPAWPKFLLLLGDASYSIYLIPPLILPVAFPIYHAVFRASPSVYFCGTVYILGTLLFGILLWKFYEAPVSQKAKAWLLRFAPASVGTTVSI